MQTSHAITKKSASNLALAFVMLPREKRDAIWAQTAKASGAPLKVVRFARFKVGEG